MRRILFVVGLLLSFTISTIAQTKQTPQKTFVWFFEAINWDNDEYLDNLESYLEHTLDDEKYADFFQVLERKDYSKFKELKRTEGRFRENDRKYVEKEIGAEVVCTGKLIYRPNTGMVQFEIELVSILTFEVIAGGYINTNANDVSDQVKMNQLIESLFDSEIIPKLRKFNKRNLDVNNGIRALQKSKDCNKGLHIKIDRGLPLLPNEQDQCQELQDEGLGILRQLASGNDIVAIDALLNFLLLSPTLNSTEIDALKLKKAEIYLDKEFNCLQELDKELPVPDNELLECFKFVHKALNILEELRDKGNGEAIKMLIGFYKIKNPIKHSPYIGQLEKEFNSINNKINNYETSLQ